MDDKEKLTRRPRPQLTLRGKPLSGTVKQSFSHGRVNDVVVERKRRRGATTTKIVTPTTVSRAPAAKRAPSRSAAPSPSSHEATGALTQAEREARSRALQGAHIRAEESNRRRIENETKERERRAREAVRKREAEALASSAAAKAASEQGPPPPVQPPALDKARAGGHSTKSSREGSDKGGGDAKKRTSSRGKPSGDGRPGQRDQERRRVRLTISQALREDEGRARSIASFRRRVEREKRRSLEGTTERTPHKVARLVTLPETISIQELASRMSERASDVLSVLVKQGLAKAADEVIDADTAQIVAEDMGHSVRRVAESDVEEGFLGSDDDPQEALEARPPIVTIMGHVDHGKTSLLDVIRQSNVAVGEAGGITQHIGAYQVETKDGRQVTFFDTPGHEAFSAMRARGASATDIIVLVVAADDGPQPQTVEAINHARASEVPMIVAINKIDSPRADVQRVKTDLLQHNIHVESLGGEVLVVEVSALKKTNIDGLLDAILLQAEVLELKANPQRRADGVVIESRVDQGRGSVTQALVRRGTLKIGDIVVAGTCWGRVRAIFNDRGERIKNAVPSMPIEILGLNGSAESGDPFAVVKNEARAREITAYRERTARDMMADRHQTSEMSFEALIASGKVKTLRLLIKADVFGSLEAIRAALEKLSNDEVKVEIVHAGVGAISESDIVLAKTTDAFIIGFNVRAARKALDVAGKDKVDIRTFNVIYHLIDSLKQAMEGMLVPEIRETPLGESEVLEVFHISKVGRIAGCRVAEGTMKRGAIARIWRDDVVVHEGKLNSLKRFKDQVQEVQVGQECGIGFENFHDVKQGDRIESFSREEVRRTLEQSA